jgi:hypothetical protein
MLARGWAGPSRLAMILFEKYGRTASIRSGA